MTLEQEFPAINNKRTREELENNHSNESDTDMEIDVAAPSQTIGPPPPQPPPPPRFPKLASYYLPYGTDVSLFEQVFTRGINSKNLRFILYTEPIKIRDIDSIKETAAVAITLSHLGRVDVANLD